MSDTMEPMRWSQGPFDHRMSPSADWQQAGPPVPGAYPPGGQYPQDSPYPGGGKDEPGGQYPLTGAFQQPGPPLPWPEAPAGAMPVFGVPALPAGPDQYSQGDAYPGPYGNGQGQFPPAQFGPRIQYGPGRHRGGQGLLGKLPFKLSPVPVAVAVALAVGIFIVVVGAHALSSEGGSSSSAVGKGTAAAATPIASSATGTTTSTGTSASTGTSVLTQQQAATALSGLLVQSGTDHAGVNAAIANVKGCTDLTAAAQTFTKAAANRRTMLALLAKLRQVPGRSALSPAMLTDLTDGWQASATVDADLANWATSEVGHCTKNDLGNPAYTASLRYDSKATNSKTAFVQQWNGLARKYGLAVYQPSQI